MNTHPSCGAERQVGHNRHLLMLDEDNPGLIQLWNRDSAESYRYCFVPMKGTSVSAVVNLIDAFNSLRGAGMEVVTAWRYKGEGSNRVRAVAMHRALEKSGWQVIVVDEFALAMRNARAIDFTGFVPEICSRDLLGRFLVVRGEETLSVLSRKPFVPTLRHFAQTQRFVPSAEFVESICAYGMTLAYLSTTSDSKHGVVLIGPAKEAPDPLAVMRAGDLHEVLWDARAEQVWEI